MTNKTDLIIPSWNNPTYLRPCLLSLEGNPGINHIYVVNNGHEESCSWIPKSDMVTVLNAGANLGWEGGLKLGLEHSTAPYVCFFNDDAFIPPSSRTWLADLVRWFDDPEVGAVGPSSNVVMGYQNIFVFPAPTTFKAVFLIGFCVVVRRAALDNIGGVDDSLPGGDDLDLSIRLRQGGYRLIGDRRVFVYHHGFKTGERIHGTSQKPGGWNSYEFRERTDHALITKHGFRAWWETTKGAWQLPPQ